MKKFSIMLLSAMALAGFTACDDAPAEPPMQSNPQEPVLVAGDITSTASSFFQNPPQVIELQDYVDNSLIPALTLDNATNLPEGAEVKYYFEISPEADFSGTVKTLDIEFIDTNEGYIDATRWSDAQIELFGKNPEKVRTVYYRIPVYVTLDGTEYRYESTSYYVSSGKLDVRCIDTGFVIYPSYYLIGDFCDWDLATMPKLNHSDADVYDDPVFSILVEVPAGCYWKVANNLAFEQQSWDAAYYWGTADNGDENLVGKLVNPCQTGRIPEAGKYLFTFNMESLDYTIVPFNRPEYLATPGNANGWSQPTSQYLHYFESDDAAFFYGVAVIDGIFKMTDGNSWDNDKTWGLGSGAGVLAQPGDNITVDEKALYWVKADLVAMTYTLYKVNTLGVLGGSDWENQQNLTPNADFTVWEGDVNLDGEWKVRVNDDWDLNLGGDLLDPSLNGSNFTVAPGAAHVTIDLTQNWPVITVVAL